MPEDQQDPPIQTEHTTPVVDLNSLNQEPSTPRVSGVDQETVTEVSSSEPAQAIPAFNAFDQEPSTVGSEFTTPETVTQEPLVAPVQIPPVANSFGELPVAIEPVQQPPTVGVGQTPAFAALTSQPKKRKKGLFISIIVAVIIVLLGTGTALAYKYWYQDPEKVVTDALVNAVTAKSVSYTGSIAVDGDSYKVNVALTGKQGSEAGTLDAKLTVAISGQNYSVDGSMLVDKSGELYIKVSHLDDIMSEFKKMIPTDPSYSAAVSSLINRLKAKIDGVWIKISSDVVKSFSDSYATTQTCVTNAVSSLKGDTTARSEITALYKKHQFITIDKQLGAKDGSLGYEITSNQATTKAFVTGLKDTKIYKQLHACDSSFTINASDFAPGTTKPDGSSTVTVWVSRWTHQLTRVAIDGTDSDGTKIDASVQPTFNQPVTVQTPANATTLEQLKNDLSDLLQSVYTSSYDSSVAVPADSSLAL